MQIIHVAAECYPVAKAGGLGDVAGALPKYLVKAGHDAKLVMPMYRTPFLYSHKWINDFQGRTHVGDFWFNFTIIRERDNTLGFDLYLVDINGVLDRDRIYGYSDDTFRFIAFQTAVVNWLAHWNKRPDIIHCHDHQAALIPFMVKYCYAYSQLASIPTILTIHNAQYQGQFGWDHSNWLPEFDPWKGGLLEWNKDINPLASGIKNAWKVNTVSPGYLGELRRESKGLEALFEYEKGKCSGILNGIDTELWNPETDKYLPYHYNSSDFRKGKKANKQRICETFGIDPQKPLFAFIGRLVSEKAADLLPDAIVSSLYLLGGKICFIVLGSGLHQVENQLKNINAIFPGLYHADIGYNEGLSHLLYAGADFLLMPSRVEPCGLNQMYAMRYGTIPIVRRTGGLQDTVKDIGDNGWGICFNNASTQDIIYSTGRALELWKQKEGNLSILQEKLMHIDHSWEHTVQEYIKLYQSCR